MRLAALSVERLSTFCRSPLAATRGTIRTPPEGRNSNGSSSGSASGWGARERGAFQDGEDRIYRDGARGARSGEVRGAMNSVHGASPAPERGCVAAPPTSSLKSGRHYPSHLPDQAPEDGSEDPHKTIRGKVASIISRSSSPGPPTLAATRNSSNLAPQTSSATSDLDPLRSTATSTTAVELQEVLVQPSRNLDTDDHHACLDSFRPGAVAVEHLQLNEPQESELSIPKSSESRDTTPGVDFPVSPSSNRNGSNGSISVAASTFVEEAMAAAPPVRKRQQLWRRNSTLVEDLERTTIPTRPPQPSAQNRRSSWLRNLPIAALSPNSWRARSLSAPPILRRASSEITISEMAASGMAASRSGMAAFQREMSKCGQGLSRASQDAYDKGRGSAPSFSGLSTSPSNPGLAAVKREMNKNEQELLNKPNTWRVKTYYVFPLLAKLRHADHPSRIIFPAAYIIFVCAMLSEVNFGVRGTSEHQPRCDSGSTSSRG